MTEKLKTNTDDTIDTETTSIYLLPLFEDEAPEQFNILIQTDGNNRAKGLNQGYDDGGKNVVNIARHLATRGDVSTMLACIMSCDNADKRGEDFFWKMYQAFVALGMRIQTDGILINDNIRLMVSGQLENLKSKGPNAKKLAEIIEQVCRLTDGIREPKMTLSLGVNYDANIALDNEVDIIVRSGMEEPGTMRLSGMKTAPRISNVGSTTLWPHMRSEEIDTIIEKAKKDIHQGFKNGYTPEGIAEIIRSTKNGGEKPVTITVPFSGDVETITSTLDKNFRGEQEKNSGSIHVMGKTGEIVRSYRGDPKTTTFHIVPGSSASRFHPEGGYTMIVAPGQEERNIVLPETPEADYATIISCEKNPRAIAEAVKKAIIFCTRHEKLKGAERKSSANKTRGAYELPEYQRYRGLQMHFQGNGHRQRTVEEVAASLIDDSPEQNSFELKADLFVAKMLNWGEKIGAPLKREVEFLAFTNYVLTSYFMTYFPEHPEWEKYGEEWEKNAEILAKYMGLIYMADEAIYDIEDENPEEKKTRITKATEILTAAIYDLEPANGEEPVDETTKNIASELRKLSRVLKAEAHPEMYRRWQKALAHLFKSFTEEWNEEIFKNPLVHNLKNSPSENREAFRAKYYHGKPPFIQRKIDDAMGEISNPRLHDIQLLTYLFDIENSIGAGLAYRTLANTVPGHEIDEQFTEELEEICTLSNFYFRLANDLSGFLSRNQGDIETKQDACTIMISKHMDTGKEEPAAILLAVGEIKTLIEELKREINSKRTAFAEKWPQLGTPIIRADIAELIYKEGHYRTTNRSKMSSHFDKLKKTGIVRSAPNTPHASKSRKKEEKAFIHANGALE